MFKHFVSLCALGLICALSASATTATAHTSVPSMPVC